MPIRDFAHSAHRVNKTAPKNENRLSNNRRILVTSVPAPGHVVPMLTIACHLRDCGHSVIFNTGEVFREQVESEGLRFVPLIGKANFDYRTFNKFLPEGVTLTPGTEEMIHNLQHVFGDTMLPQYDGLCKIMNCEPVSLILADLTFFGVLPLLVGSQISRPKVVSVGVCPMVLSSDDVSLLHGPAVTVEERECNREENRQFQATLACVNDYINRLLSSQGRPPLPDFLSNCLYTLPDLFLQLTAESFEFPRADMPGNVRFVGPVLPKRSTASGLPAWWKDIDKSKPVVLVTQGTYANADLSELIGPTVAGLSTEEMTVIAATGKPVGDFLVPANARVIPFIPFAEVLSEVDVFVTNGGYGAVNQALSMGVPLVIAGVTEDKAFVSTRVEWSGAGINLRTSRPTPEQIRHAVREVLEDDRYWANARRLKKSFAQHDALDEIACHIEPIVARHDTSRIFP